MHDIALMEDELFGFVEFLVVAVIGGGVLVLGFLAFAATRPAGNPLRQVAALLATRLGVTVAVGAVDLPMSVIAPPLGGLMDIASFFGLAAYWIYGLLQAARAFMPVKPPQSGIPPEPPTIDYIPAQPHHTQAPLAPIVRAAPTYPAQ